MEISSQNFARLKSHAEPLVDTIDTVIGRALDALDASSNAPSKTPTIGASGITEMTIQAKNLPDLTHTKVLEAVIDGKAISKPNWNNAVREMLIAAMRQLDDFDALRKACPINLVRGEKTGTGYKYMPEIDVSYQGIDANNSGKMLVNAAIRLGFSLSIGFLWHQKETAAFPGKLARMTVN